MADGMPDCFYDSTLKLVVDELARQASTQILFDFMETLPEHINASTIAVGLLKYIKECDGELDVDGLVCMGDGSSEKEFEQAVCADVSAILRDNVNNSPLEGYIYEVVRKFMAERIVIMKKAEPDEL